MILRTPLVDADSFVDDLCNGGNNQIALSRIQKKFISFCITALIVIGSLCWEKMERASLRGVSAKALGWMLHYSIIPWFSLWEASILRLIKISGLKGVLLIDDADRYRAKGTWSLFGIHKVKDKRTSGFSMAQNLVFLVFVTKFLTIPVGFRFFQPDPNWKKWTIEDEKQRKAGIKKANRPPKPLRNSKYPMRSVIAANLIADFKKVVPNADITAIVADAAYLVSTLIKAAKKYFSNAQFISQVRSNAIVSDGSAKKRGKKQQVNEYFKNKKPITTEVSLRGMPNKKVTMISARLYVHSQQKKLHIIALKYDDEIEYRYLAATKLSWRAIDIVRAYAMRWLVEVVIEDWKVYDGWGKMAFQRGFDGACRGVILSLLVDHFLCSHPIQLKRLNANIPVFTAGSLCRYFQNRSILSEIASILKEPCPMENLRKLVDNIENVVDFRESDKHMSGHNIGEFEESPNLKRCYKYAS